MPYSKVVGGHLTGEQKERLTEMASEIMAVSSEFFMTTIEELPEQNIGIGGRAIDKIKQEYQKNTEDLL